MTHSHNIVRENTIRAYLYMGILTTVIGLLGYFISSTFNFGLTGTGIFLIIIGIIDFLAFFFSDTIVIKSSRAKPLMPEAAPEYYAMVQELTREVGIPMPKLYYIDTESMNAFATGRNPSRAAVVATRGLLEKLTPEEIKGVIAHELAHVKNFDTRLMAIVSILAGLIMILADMYWKSHIVSKASEKDRSGVLSIIGLFLALFAPISAMLIQLAVSRRREYTADAIGATFVKNPLFLASALEKISRDRLPLPQASRVTAHLYISNPLHSEGLLDRMFSTHPPVEERIRNLKMMVK